MSNKVRCVNLALNRLGQEPVADLSEASQDTSKALVKILRIADDARESVLRRHGWKCALEYTTLPPAVIDGYANWKFPAVYALPGNGLRVWLIQGLREDDFRGRWELGTLDQDRGARIIIRGKDPTANLNVAYIRLASWEAIDATLEVGLGLTMAAMAAYSVTGEAGLSAQLSNEAEKRIMEAISIDGTQEEGGEPLTYDIPAALRRMAGESGPWAPWPGGRVDIWDLT